VAKKIGSNTGGLGSETSYFGQNRVQNVNQICIFQKFVVPLQRF